MESCCDEPRRTSSIACFSASMAFISFSRRLRLSFSADARLRLPTALNFSVSIASDCAAVSPGLESVSDAVSVSERVYQPPRSSRCD